MSVPDQFAACLLAGATVNYSQRALIDLCRALAREGLRDHEIEECTGLDRIDIRRWLGDSWLP